MKLVQGNCNFEENVIEGRVPRAAEQVVDMVPKLVAVWA